MQPVSERVYPWRALRKHWSGTAVSDLAFGVRRLKRLDHWPERRKCHGHAENEDVRTHIGFVAFELLGRRVLDRTAGRRQGCQGLHMSLPCP